MQPPQLPPSVPPSPSVSFTGSAPSALPNSESPLPFKLLQLNGSFPNRIYHIQGKTNPDGTVLVLLGRSVPGNNADVSVDEPVVSRKHATLFFDGETLSIRHLSESNPTLVNNESLMAGDKKYLKINDIITLADIQLKLYI